MCGLKVWGWGRGERPEDREGVRPEASKHSGGPRKPSLRTQQESGEDRCSETGRAGSGRLWGASLVAWAWAAILRPSLARL